MAHNAPITSGAWRMQCDAALWCLLQHRLDPLTLTLHYPKWCWSIVVGHGAGTIVGGAAIRQLLTWHPDVVALAGDDLVDRPSGQ